MNDGKIFDEVANAFEDGYQRGLKENEENNKKLRNLQDIITKDATKRREKVIAVDSKTFENIYGKEVKLLLPTEILQEMCEDIDNYRGY